MLALAAASLSPVSTLAAPSTPGLQPAATPLAVDLDDRALPFALDDYVRERAELAQRASRARPKTRPKPAAAKPKSSVRAYTKPQQHKKTTVKKRTTIRTRTQTRPTPPLRVNGSRARTVINFALAQVGKPYRWAADGPGSYDCSGLVVAAFRRVGLSLPHQTGGLVGRGRKVSRAQLQPGDIVFPSSGHVGIYLGRGRMVHAPKPGDHVRVAAMYDFWTARRLL